MNLKTTLILIVLLIVVGVTAYLQFSQDTDLARQNKPDQENAQKLLSAQELDPKTISRIEIAQADEKPFALSKIDGKWWQTEPVVYPLREMAVEDLLRISSLLTVFQAFEPGEDGLPSLDELDLAPALATVKMTGDNTSVQFNLGRVGAKGRAYLTLNDDNSQVYVVRGTLHSQTLLAEAHNFRVRHVKPLGMKLPASADVVIIENQDLDQRAELHRIDGRWFMNPEGTERASREAVESLIATTNELPIQQYITTDSDSLASFGLQPAQTSITIQANLPAENGQTQTLTHQLHLGNIADIDGLSRFARWSFLGPNGELGGSSEVFTVLDASVSKFREPIDELRDTRLTTLNPDQLISWSLEPISPWEDAALDYFVLTRPSAADRWQLKHPEHHSVALDSDLASIWLESLDSQRVTVFAPPPPTETPPIGKISLSTADRGQIVSLYRPTHVLPDDLPEDMAEAVLFGVVQGETIAMGISAEMVAMLLDAPSVLYDRSFDLGNPELWQQIKIEHGFGGQTYQFDRIDIDTWQLAGHENFERQAFEQVLELLQNPTAERVLPHGVDTIDAFAHKLNQWLKIYITSKPTHPDDPPHTDYFFINPNTNVAMVPNNPRLRKLSNAWIDTLSQEFRFRTVLSLDTANISRVTYIPMEGDEITLERDTTQPSGFRSEQDSVDQEAVAGLIDAVRNLRVARYLSQAPKPYQFSFIQIETTTGDMHELQLLEPFMETRIIHLNDEGWYLLSEATVEKLTGLISQDKDR